MAGYVRNDTTNNISDGNIINASDLDGEFDAIQAAFVNTTGHTHDGTAAEGAPITKIGPTQNVVATSVDLSPKTTNTIDLGSNSLKYKNIYAAGTAFVGTLDLTNALAVADGGTGATSFTANNVLLGNGSSAFQAVAPGTSGNVLTSNGTTWVSSSVPSQVYPAAGIAVSTGSAWGTSKTTPTGDVVGTTDSQALTNKTINGSSNTITNVSLTTGVTGTLPLANGGSGQTTAQAAMNAFAGAVTSGQYLRGNGTNVVMSSIQAADVPTLNQNTTGTAANVTGVVAAANGGTGQSSYDVGDLLFASTTTALSKLADVATGNALISGGVGVAPSYGKIGLTTHVSGTLAVANGGTNATATPTAGAVSYGTGTAYAFNTAGTSGQPLLSGGTGAPTFGTLSIGAGGTGQTTASAAFNALSPITSTGDLIIGNGTNSATRLAIGANNTVLTSNGTTATWAAAAGASLLGQTDSASPFETSLGYQAGNVNTGAQNTFIGYQSGLANTTGTQNTAVGYLALDANTTGQFNSALGNNALGTNTINSYCTAVGSGALAVSNVNGNTAVGASAAAATTNGGDNTAVGSLALTTNTTGASNSAFGSQALAANTTASNNSAFGYFALKANTTGINNTAVGSNALVANTTGQRNCAFGQSALAANTTGNDNIAVGRNALASSTISTSAVAIGSSALSGATSNVANSAVAIGNNAATSATSDATSSVSIGANSGSAATITSSVAIGNAALRGTSAANSVAIGANSLGGNTNSVNVNNTVAIGFTALGSLTTGTGNTAVGYQALDANTIGTNNTAVGSDALGANTTGINNTAVGINAGLAVTTGTQNTLLGSNAGNSGTNNLTTGSNNTIIGYNAAASAATVSNEITLGNASIATIRAQVTTITALSDARDKTDIAPLSAGLAFTNALKPVAFTWNMRDGGKVGVPDTGFIAQDLKAVQEQTGISIPGLVYESNPDRLEAGYGKLLPVLVKAIQELSAEVELLKSQLKGN